MVLSTEGKREREREGMHTQTQNEHKLCGGINIISRGNVQWEKRRGSIVFIVMNITIEYKNWVKPSLKFSLFVLMKDIISNCNRPTKIKALIILFQFQGLNLSQIITFSTIWKKWLPYTSACASLSSYSCLFVHEHHSEHKGSTYDMRDSQMKRRRNDKDRRR